MKGQKHGWGSLSAKDTGRIGGLITRRKQREDESSAGEQETFTMKVFLLTRWFGGFVCIEILLISMTH